jgi:5-methylthioadenosine/S-adenosylhomocysteine deaminase
MHQGHLTGSLEPGKRADLIVVDRRTLHNSPRFARDSDAIYSQIVYAGKSTDVAHVMVNGAWVMRDRKVLTIDEETVMKEASALAKQIDAFLVAREGNVLNKLVAIGGIERKESFEIQVKANLPNADVIDKLLKHADVQLVRQTHYRQYDTYFLFDDESQGRVRYREDDMLNDKAEVESLRTRLTYTSPVKEREFDNAVLLSRSQFIAPADRPLRFYREYFRPNELREVQKERRRWHILYKGVLFYVNVDTMILPKVEGQFLEIKSQTWSKFDAEYKATLIREMLNDVLQLATEERVRKEYIDFAPA